MAEMLMDGLGSANYAIVDDSNRLWTAGSITSMPTMTISSVGISGMVNDWTLNLKQYMDYEDKYQPVYIGLALPGTGSEIAGWMIRKNIYDTNEKPIAVLFGSGNTNFNTKWSERSGIYAEYS